MTYITFLLSKIQCYVNSNLFCVGPLLNNNTNGVWFSSVRSKFCTNTWEKHFLFPIMQTEVCVFCVKHDDDDVVVSATINMNTKNPTFQPNSYGTNAMMCKSIWIQKTTRVFKMFTNLMGWGKHKTFYEYIWIPRFKNIVLI